MYMPLKNTKQEVQFKYATWGSAVIENAEEAERCKRRLGWLLARVSARRKDHP